MKSKWELEVNIKLSEGDWHSIWRTQQNFHQLYKMKGVWMEELIWFFCTLHIKKAKWVNSSNVGRWVPITYVIPVMCKITGVLGQSGADSGRHFSSRTFRDRQTIYLGLTPEGSVQKDPYLFKILILACKIAITRNWLKSDPQCPGQWLDIVEEIY